MLLSVPDSNFGERFPVNPIFELTVRPVKWYSFLVGVVWRTRVSGRGRDFLNDFEPERKKV